MRRKTLKNYSMRTLALLLSLLMVVYLIPTTVFASMANTNDTLTSEQTQETQPQISTSSPYFAEEEFIREIECEITELRESNIKHYLMNDGTYMMQIFSYDVHYLDAEGKWLEFGSGNLTATTQPMTTSSSVKITSTSSTMVIDGLNNLPKGAFILDATLETTLQKKSNTRVTLRATSGVSKEEANAELLSRALDNSIVVYEKETESGISEFNITNAAREAVASGNPCNIVFEGVNNTVANNLSNQTRSVATVYYSTPIGLESYWSTTAQSAGFAGTGYVDNQTGGLTFVIDTLTTTDYLMPTGFPLVYNSIYAGEGVDSSSSAMAASVPLAGNGFKLGILETIVPYTIDGVQHYIYTDSDGTQHLFKPKSGNIYEDNSGLNYTLTVNYANYLYEIRDADGNYYGYHVMTDGTYRGVLVNITDTSGNTLMLDVADYQRPYWVRLRPNGLSPILQLHIRYNSASQICRVYNPNTYESYIFYYSTTYNGTSISQENTGFLRKMIYAKGTAATTVEEWAAFTSATTGGTITNLAEASYEYDSNGRLISVRDELQRREIHYTYDSAGKVSNVKEYAGYYSAYLSAGQEIGFTYYTTSTHIRSSGTDDIYGTADDLYTHYTFDTQGRTVTSYITDLNSTNLYGASSVQYVDSNVKAKNSIKNSVNTNGEYVGV